MNSDNNAKISNLKKELGQNELSVKTRLSEELQNDLDLLYPNRFLCLPQAKGAKTSVYINSYGFFNFDGETYVHVHLVQTELSNASMSDCGNEKRIVTSNQINFLLQHETDIEILTLISIHKGVNSE